MQLHGFNISSHGTRLNSVPLAPPVSSSSANASSPKRKKHWQSQWHTVSWMAILLVGLTCNAATSKKYTLEEPVDDDRVFGIGLRLDVQGKVQTRGAENKNVDLPLTGSAAL